MGQHACRGPRNGHSTEETLFSGDHNALTWSRDAGKVVGRQPSFQGAPEIALPHVLLALGDARIGPACTRRWRHFWRRGFADLKSERRDGYVVSRVRLA